MRGVAARTLLRTGLVLTLVGCSLLYPLDDMSNGGAEIVGNDGGEPDGGDASGENDASGEGGIPVPKSCPGGDCRGDDCCHTIFVPGGTFNRSNDPQYPATVS